jgi:hypothetical protein
MDSRKSFVSSQRIQEVFDHPASSNASARPAAIGPSSRKVAIVSQLISRPKSAVSSSDLRTRLTADLAAEERRQLVRFAYAPDGFPCA